MPPKSQKEAIEHPLVYASFQDQAWMILPAKLEEIVALVEAHLEGKQIAWPEVANGKSGLRADETYQIQEGVAIIPVFGSLLKRANMFSRMSGGTSYELLGAQIKQALADPKVTAILLDVDSPGGVADGVKTVADQILAARGQKPIVAFAHGQMCSAAFWIGASADQVMADDTAMVGSIGTLMTHTDRSAQDAQQGIKRTHIFAGRYKVAGSDAQPLTAEDQTYLQGIIDYLNQLFLAGVSQGRGKDLATVQKEMAEGRIFIGQQAQDAGLVDQIGNLNDALDLARAKGEAMPKNMTKATLLAGNPELFQEILAEGAAGVTLAALLEKQPEAAAELRKEGQEAGAQAERARVVEILEAAGGQGLMLQVLKNGTGVKDTLKLMVANHEQMKAETLKAMYGAAPPVLGTEAPRIETQEGADRVQPIETRAKAEWDKDPKLQAEFEGKFEKYLIYQRHKEAGDIKEK